MKTERNPENTRNKIIQAAFQEMHKHGYQGMRVDQVLKNTDLKKGAMYHHFPSKQALGYAVLEERIQKRITELWITPLETYDDPLLGIHSLFKKLDKEWSDDFFNLGCPLNNLAQEMSPIDEGFRERIENFFMCWKTAISAALKRGQQQGIVDKSINIDDCSIFILAAIEGTLGMVKNHQNKAVYYSCSKELERYLNILRTK
ncbi:MAG: TetR family transcriptional regulator [Methylomarinum sp.]|nr:TetR family transcriptional regulator [Methylomarinum sp.]